MDLHVTSIRMENHPHHWGRPTRYRAECECGYRSGWQRYRHMAELRERDHHTITAREQGE